MAPCYRVIQKIDLPTLQKTELYCWQLPHTSLLPKTSIHRWLLPPGPTLSGVCSCLSPEAAVGSPTLMPLELQLPTFFQLWHMHLEIFGA